MGIGLLSLLAACVEEQKQEEETLAIDIMSHNNEDEILEGEVEFRAMVHPIDNIDDLSVSWYLDDELICDWDTPSPIGYSFCITTLTTENGKIRADIKDADGDTASEEISFTVISINPPVVEELLALNSDENYYSDHPIYFTATVSDAEDAAEDLSVIWTSSRDGELELGSTPSPEGKITGSTLLSQGNHTIELAVTDTFGKVTTDSISVSVGGDNELPTTSITAPNDGQTIVVGTQIDFAGLVDDPDISNDRLSVEWHSDRDGRLDTSGADSDGNVSFSTDTLSAAIHTISLNASDEVGGSGSSEITLNVSHIPTASISSPIDGVLFSAGQTVELVGIAADQDDASEDLSVSWSSSIDGELFTGNADSSGQSVFSTSELTVGFHDFTFTVTDTSGLEASDTITVQINTLPEVDSITFSPDPVYSNQDLTASAIFSDAEGHTVTGAYEWYENGTLTSHVGTTISASELDVTETWTVRVTPNDGFANGTYLEQSITVSNTDPTITTPEISSSGGSDFFNSSTLTCSATASDIDESVTATYSWNVGENSYSGASLDLSTITVLPEDTIECVASVTDPQGGTASDSASITLDNRAPSVDSVDITPNTGVFSNTQVVCSSVVSDADGESLTATYEWFNGEDSLGTGDTLDLTSEIALPTDEVECVATVEDNYGETATLSASVTIENTDPTIDTSSLEPATPSKIDTVTCSATASDIDGDSPTLSFAFSNQTTSATYTATTTNADSAELDLNGSGIQMDDVLLCEITAEDANGGTVSTTVDVTIVNAPPAFIDEAAITPETGVFTGTELTCSATGDDLEDGDLTATYSWTVNGTELGTDATYTVDADETDVDDSITCTATLTDADNQSVTSSTSVTVENTDPTITTPEITPNTGILSDSVLTCSATADDIDEDVEIEYSWEQNDTEIATGETIDLSNFTILHSDTISCVASVDDSNGGSASDSADVMLDEVPVFTSDATITPDSGVFTGTSLTCASVGTDTEDGSLTPAYSWTVNGNEVSTTDSYTIDASETDVDDSIVCTATIEDSAGQVVTTADSVIIENTDPTVTTPEITPNTGLDVNSVLTCSATGDDIDETVTVSYVWEQNGSEVSTGDTIDLSNFTVLPSDVISCVASVADSNGGSASDSADVMLNEAPTFTSDAAITPDSGVFTGTSLTCAATGTDTEDGSLTATYSWTVNGNEVSTTDSYTVDASETDVGDSIVCTASLEDSVGQVVTTTDSVTVENTDPTVTVPTISPNSSVLNDSSLTCSATGDDADETVTVTYAWEQNGSEIATGDTIDLSTHTILPDDTITCVASVADSNSGSDEASDFVTVDNRDPSVTTPVLSNSSPVADETITCSATADDADGETVEVEYSWTIDGNAAGDDTDTLVLTAQTASVGDEIICTATVNDGYGGTAFDTVFGTVQNTNPTISSTTITPNSGVLTGTQLTCDATGDDLNDGSLTPTYSWTVNSVEVGTGVNYTVDASDTNVGDSITCTSTVEDNNSGTANSSLSVTVENTDPTISNMDVSGTSGSFYLSETLTCSATIEDPDESLTPTYSWTSGGIEIGTDETLDLATTALLPGDSLTCTIDVADSDSGTAQDSVTVTIGDAPPTAPTVLITWTAGGNAPVDGDDLTCSASGSTDPEGNTVTYSYAWTSDLGGSVSGATVLSTETVLDEVWTCTATASDGSETTTATASATISAGLSWDDCPVNPDISDALVQFSSVGISVRIYDYGYSSFGGDIDGDGKEDLLSHFNTYGAHIILGSRIETNTTGFDYTFADVNGHTVIFIQYAGDIDNDGLDDVLVVYRDDALLTDRDAYLFLGSSLSSLGATIDPTTDADYTFTSVENNHGASSIGDIDGDNLDDIILGKYIFLGSSLATANSSLTMNDADYSIPTPTSEGQAAPCGDLNGDGSPDFIHTDASKTFIYSGADISLLYTIDTPRGAPNKPICADFDGDNILDIVRSHTSGFMDDETWIYLGSDLLSYPSGSIIPDTVAEYRFRIENPTGIVFGLAPTGLVRSGDLDGDGLPDLVIGQHEMHMWDGAAANYGNGSVNIVFGADLPAPDGSTTMITTPSHYINGGAGIQYFGLGLAVGDFNGDGFDDIVAQGQSTADSSYVNYGFSACEP